jgi:metallo-beta-lactamase class B
MKISNLFTLIFILLRIVYPQTQFETIEVSKDIDLIKLTENVYIHISYFNSEQYGRFPSNGMIYIQDDEAFLFDTPMTEKLTRDLISFITDSMKINIKGFIPNHWHNDCIGGLEYLNQLGINSYANQITIEIADLKHLPLPKNGFKDSLTIKFGNNEIVCKYLGAGHSTDNIVIWLPSEKILFGGCMVKEMNSTGLGNIEDADLDQWPETIKKVTKEFSDANYIIPGHGKIGGIELLAHTLELLKNKK